MFPVSIHDACKYSWTLFSHVVKWLGNSLILWTLVLWFVRWNNVHVKANYSLMEKTPFLVSWARPVNPGFSHSLACGKRPYSLSSVSSGHCYLYSFHWSQVFPHTPELTNVQQNIQGESSGDLGNSFSIKSLPPWHLSWKYWFIWPHELQLHCLSLGRLLPLPVPWPADCLQYEENRDEPTTRSCPQTYKCIAVSCGYIRNLPRVKVQKRVLLWVRQLLVTLSLTLSWAQ